MATPARVRGVIDARGENIYGDIGVQREVYAFRSNIRSGNSGGPLVDDRGRILGLVLDPASIQILAMHSQIRNLK